MMSTEKYCEVAAASRAVLSEPEHKKSTSETVAAFARKLADLFKADNPGKSDFSSRSVGRYWNLKERRKIARV